MVPSCADLVHGAHRESVGEGWGRREEDGVKLVTLQVPVEINDLSPGLLLVTAISSM